MAIIPRWPAQGVVARGGDASVVVRHYLASAAQPPTHDGSEPAAAAQRRSSARSAGDLFFPCSAKERITMVNNLNRRAPTVLRAGSRGLLRCGRCFSPIAATGSRAGSGMPRKIAACHGDVGDGEVSRPSQQRRQVGQPARRTWPPERSSSARRARRRPRSTGQVVPEMITMAMASQAAMISPVRSCGRSASSKPAILTARPSTRISSSGLVAACGHR